MAEGKRPEDEVMRGWIVIISVVLMGLVVGSAQAKYGGGTGEPNDPYLIYDANHMQAIGADSNDWDKHFLLCADIDLSGFTGKEFNIIGYYENSSDNKPFTGVFDGDDHVISNFTYDSNERNYIGLFGWVDDPNAEIRSLGLIDPNIKMGTGYYLGSLVGYFRDGTITGCYIDGGSVSGTNQVGGLVGGNGGTIISCYSTGSISGTDQVGGLAGNNYGGTIGNCYSTSSASGIRKVGGLVGDNYEGTINESYATGDTSGTGWCVGGLVGENPHGIISNCYAKGVASGYMYVGGLAGSNSEGKISNSYSTGSVTGDGDVGGLVGYDPARIEVWHSFWDVNTSGQATSAGGTGKTTAEMQTAITFVMWKCNPVWTIDEGNDYPRLRWEDMPGEPIPVYSYGGGSGEPNDPYLIFTAEQLNTVGLIECDWDKHFKLMADIDLSGFSETSFNIIGYFLNRFYSDNKPFTGVFDGNSHTISNFTYTTAGVNCIGLFGYVDSPNAEIKNLGLIDPNVYAGIGDYVGSLVGYFKDGTTTECYVEGGSVSGTNQVGGLVGGNIGRITNCYSTGSVVGEDDVGGLVGGSIGSRPPGINNGTITNCYSTGNVEGYYDVGGLVGGNSSRITNCYSTGSVLGYYDVGGLVGFSSLGRITNCYSAASASGDEYVGGLLGNNMGCKITNSYWDIETSGQVSSAGGTGLPTADMQMQITFTDAGWDFIEIWGIGENQTYPYLRKYSAANINKDNKVDFLDIRILCEQWLEEK